METVGHYAVSLRWKDGHDTGIYPWVDLRKWCPCAACGGALAGTPEEIAELVPQG